MPIDWLTDPSKRLCNFPYYIVPPINLHQVVISFLLTCEENYRYLSLMVHPTMKKIANCFIYTPHERETHTSNRFQSKFIKILFLLSLSLVDFFCMQTQLIGMHDEIPPHLSVIRELIIIAYNITIKKKKLPVNFIDLWQLFCDFLVTFLSFNEKLECYKIKRKSKCACSYRW